MSNKVYAQRFNNSPDFVNAFESTLASVRKAINEHELYGSMPDVVKSTVIQGIVTEYAKIGTVDTLEKFDTALSTLNQQTAIYGDGFEVSRKSIDVSGYRTIGIDKDGKQSICSLSDVAEVWEIVFAADTPETKVMPTKADILKALAEVANIDVSRLDTFADWLIKRHDVSETVDRLYLVRYTVLDKGGESTKLTLATATDIPNVSYRVAPNCKTVGALRTKLRELSPELEKVDDPIVK